ncbi:MAG: sugar ABC transporter ATP-binding protein [Rhodospirillales bacterium]
MGGSKEPAVAVKAWGLQKSYGATVALADVSLEVHPGEVHALLGENGAGKSTLVRIFSGILPADSGEMSLFGEAYRPTSIMAARAAGVTTAFQELSLLPNLSVAQNLMLPNMVKGRLGLNSKAATEERARELLLRFDLGQIDPRSAVVDLALSDRQRLEIVRALSREPRFLILDEPTASLAEVEWVFTLIREVAAKGSSVLYISHRLGEVRELCSHATILRNGRSIATVELAGADNGEIFKMMVGRSALEPGERGAARSKTAGKPALKVEGLTSKILNGVSFELNQGEILGVAALEGQGQQGLFRILGGVEQADGGTISTSGKAQRFRDPHDALTKGEGIAFVPEERKVDGIFPGMGVTPNITLSILGRLSRLGWLSGAREQRKAREVADKVELSRRYLAFRINELSGGNQQKAILARALATGARTLVLYDPTRGVDVGTKQTIYAAIRAFAEEGGSVLLYSSELPELVEVADRCLVIYGGRVLDELVGAEIEEQALVAGVTGHKHDDPPAPAVALDAAVTP